jgi:hypothetical protein
VSWWNGPDTGGKKEETQQKSIFSFFKKEEKRENKFLGFSGVVQVQIHIKRVSDLWAKILRVLVLLYSGPCLFVWNRFINTILFQTHVVL